MMFMDKQVCRLERAKPLQCDEALTKPSMSKDSGLRGSRRMALISMR
jgi:hypothetical protein